MGQKKSFTLSTDSLLSEENVPILPKEAPTKRPVGRPRIHNHRTTSTSQEGLKEGLTRMTFIITQEKQDKLKYISYFERLSIRAVLDEAIDDYLRKYEEQVGPIELNG